MTKSKDDIQKEIINTIVDSNFKGIILSSVRSGKTRILLTAICKHMVKIDKTNPFNEKSILVLYPNVDIKDSWINECDILGLSLNITYCTFASIEKIKDVKWDYVCIDEAHLLGEENQLPIAGEIAKNNKHVIFASGTYNKETLSNIKSYTRMKLIVNYSTEEAIEDGIVSDFSIFVHQYKLNDSNYIEFGKTKKWNSTEKKECNRLGNRILKSNGQQKMFAALDRMRFINSTNSLFNVVNNWIKSNPNERFILFSSSEKTGEKYQLPMFNSKSKDDSVLKAFQDGSINRLCLIKKASAGVTFPNLSNILITAINSNGENLEQMIGRSLLDDTEHSNIHIFVSNEAFQQNWLKKSLESINKNKIKYI
jgi:superfamily II DNA or RNA helicase